MNEIEVKVYCYFLPTLMQLQSGAKTDEKMAIV